MTLSQNIDAIFNESSYVVILNHLELISWLRFRQMYTVTKKLVKLKVPWGHPVGKFMIFGAQRETIVRSIQLLAVMQPRPTSRLHNTNSFLWRWYFHAQRSLSLPTQGFLNINIPTPLDRLYSYKPCHRLHIIGTDLC